MLSLFSGLVIGACLGFGLAAMLSVSKDGAEIMEEKSYKCNINARACQDTCCRDYKGCEECDWACEENPETCGKSREV